MAVAKAMIRTAMEKKGNVKVQLSEEALWQRMDQPR